MGFYVKIEGSKKLYYSLENGNSVDNEQLAAIRQLQIQGLAKVEKTTVDQQVELVYAVGGMQPLSQYIGVKRGNVNEKKEIIQYLQKILAIVQNVDKYPLLTESNIVMDLQYLWVDAKGNLYVIYLPLLEDYQNLAVAWKKLIQDLLAQVQSDEGLLFLTKQLRYIESQSIFSVTDLQSQFQKEQQVGSRNIVNETNNYSAQPMSNSTSYEQPPKIQAKNQVQSQSVQPIRPSQAEKSVQPQISVNNQQQGNNNIQMMQAPNQPINKEYLSNNGMNMPKSSNVKKKRNIAKLIIGHLVLIGIAAAMYFAGILKNKAGDLDLINVLILVFLVIGGLLFVWLKWSVYSGSTSDPITKKQNKIQKSKGKNNNIPTGGNIPGIVSSGIANQKNQSKPVIKQNKKSSAPSMPPQQQQRQPMPPQQQQRQPMPPQQQQQQPIPPQQPSQPQPPIFLQQSMESEAQGTMIFSESGSQNDPDGTVLFQQESGAFLSMKNGENKRKIEKIPYILGRRGDWIIQDPAVSGLHCQIEKQQEKFYLVDIGSKNGTFVNGTKLEVNQYHNLSQGDQIKIGNTEIIFEMF